MKKCIFGIIAAIIILFSGAYYFYYNLLQPVDKLHICIETAMEDKTYDSSNKEEIKNTLSHIWDNECHDLVENYQKFMYNERIEDNQQTVVLFSYEDFDDSYEDFKNIALNYFIDNVYYEEK